MNGEISYKETKTLFKEAINMLISAVKFSILMWSFKGIDHRIDSLLKPASSGLLMNCTFSYICIYSFIQCQRLLLGLAMCLLCLPAFLEICTSGCLTLFFLWIWAPCHHCFLMPNLSAAMLSIMVWLISTCASAPSLPSWVPFTNTWPVSVKICLGVKFAVHEISGYG